MDVERFRKNIMIINSVICAKYSALINVIQKQKYIVKTYDSTEKTIARGKNHFLRLQENPFLRCEC